MPSASQAAEQLPDTTVTLTPKSSHQRTFNSRDSLDADHEKVPGPATKRARFVSPPLPSVASASNVSVLSEELTSVLPTLGSQLTDSESSLHKSSSPSSSPLKQALGPLKMLVGKAKSASEEVARNTKKAASRTLHSAFAKFTPITREQLLEQSRIERLAKDEKREEIAEREEEAKRKRAEKEREQARVRKARQRARKRQQNTSDDDDDGVRDGRENLVQRNGKSKVRLGVAVHKTSIQYLRFLTDTVNHRSNGYESMMISLRQSHGVRMWPKIHVLIANSKPSCR